MVIHFDPTFSTFRFRLGVFSVSAVPSVVNILLRERLAHILVAKIPLSSASQSKALTDGYL